MCACGQDLMMALGSSKRGGRGGGPPGEKCCVKAYYGIANILWNNLFIFVAMYPALNTSNDFLNLLAINTAFSMPPPDHTHRKRHSRCIYSPLLFLLLLSPPPPPLSPPCCQEGDYYYYFPSGRFVCGKREEEVD